MFSTGKTQCPGMPCMTPCTSQLYDRVILKHTIGCVYRNCTAIDLRTDGKVPVSLVLSDPEDSASLAAALLQLTCHFHLAALFLQPTRLLCQLPSLLGEHGVSVLLRAVSARPMLHVSTFCNIYTVRLW